MTEEELLSEIYVLGLTPESLAAHPEAEIAPFSKLWFLQNRLTEIARGELAPHWLPRRINAAEVPERSLRVSKRFEILKRDRYRCQLCGGGAMSGMRLEVDHRVPRAKGGTNDDANLWTLCYECNRGKSDSDL